MQIKIYGIENTHMTAFLYFILNNFEKFVLSVFKLRDKIITVNNGYTIF